MRTGSNLKRRGAVYYARQVVPVDLRDALGRREFMRSLNTTDSRTASARKLVVLADWQREFADLRRRRDMTEADFAEATWQHYSSELEADASERALPGGELLTGVEARFASRESRRHQLRALREHLGVGETVLIHWAADAYIERKQLSVKKGRGVSDARSQAGCTLVGPPTRTVMELTVVHTPPAQRPLRQFSSRFPA